jgi:uncharacterized protein YggT (Ycf19 family)
MSAVAEFLGSRLGQLIAVGLLGFIAGSFVSQQGGINLAPIVNMFIVVFILRMLMDLMQEIKK